MSIEGFHHCHKFFKDISRHLRNDFSLVRSQSDRVGLTSTTSDYPRGTTANPAGAFSRGINSRYIKIKSASSCVVAFVDLLNSVVFVHHHGDEYVISLGEYLAEKVIDFASDPSATKEIRPIAVAAVLQFFEGIFRSKACCPSGNQPYPTFLS